MTTYGITDSGFVLKRLADILTDMQTVLATIQDPETGEYLTADLADENDPFVQEVNSVADAISACWEQLQLAYNQFDPLKATGAGLSGLVQLNGIKRSAGAASTVSLTMTGTASLYVAAGKQVATYDGSVVFDLPAWTFSSGGTATVIGTCTEDGANEAAIGTVTKIITPVSGWTACTNAAAATVGNDAETDAELRLRQQNSTETTGRSTVEDIYGNLLQVDNVTFARVYQNNTDIVDGRGIPAKSLAAVVLGGLDADIAELLFNQAPAMCGFYGSTTVNVEDEQGVLYGVSFSRPTQIPIYIDIAVKVVDSTLWPTDGETQIKDAILAYAETGASALNISTGYDQDGYAPGQSVYASELYTAINSVLGIQILSVYVGTAGSPTDPYVTIAWNEVAEFLTANMSVTVS